MLDPEILHRVQLAIKERIAGDSAVLDELRADIKKLVGMTSKIQPRSTTAISLVGTDGGNNKVEFDPFMLHLVRVVDSSKNEYCIEAITPTTNRTILNSQHFDAAGHGVTPLGKMMEYLGVKTLWDLSHMIQDPRLDPMPSWVQVYRELTEWAVLFSLLRDRDFGTDTVIVLDGLLRSKVYKDEYFKKLRQGLEEGIERQRKNFRRNVYIVGFAKHSKVLQRYRLAMAMEDVLRTNYACYVEVPRELEEKTYVWAEYARGDEQEKGGGEANKYVAGKMFFAKFGDRPHDPIWPVDILVSQTGEAQKIFGYLLADAQQGFPIPFYPQCLQRAHENAALVGFDMDILQNETIKAIRGTLGARAEVLDELQLENPDPSGKRYN
jgi:hypothetical protein